jgi:hypothetical protein
MRKTKKSGSLETEKTIFFFIGLITPFDMVFLLPWLNNWGFKATGAGPWKQRLSRTRFSSWRQFLIIYEH